jgi:hypothetical protein
VITVAVTTDPIGCSAGAGTSSSGQPCNQDSDCNGGKPASGYVCSSELGECIWACHSNFDCNTFQTCDTGLATYACEGNSCAADSDCNGGRGGTAVICNDSGACSWGCHSDFDCPSGQSCDQSLSTWTCR